MDFERLLEPMGVPLVSYRGTGVLELANGEKRRGRFLARQTTGGDILLLMEPENTIRMFSIILDAPSITGFTGTTHDEARIEVSGGFIPRDIPPRDVKNAEGWASFTARRMLLVHTKDRASTLRFGLTNLRLPQPKTMTFTLDDEEGLVQAQLRRLEDGRDRFKSARATRGIEVTAELIVEAGDLDAAKQTANDVCYLLSIAQGSMVRWIYLDEYRNGSLLRRRHHNKKTREYTPLAAIDTSQPQWPVEFINETHATYLKRRDDWELNRGPIDWYLEAKTEADYLEHRAAKLAVALETLKHRYVQSAEAKISEFILPPAEFAEIESNLQSRIATLLNEKGAEDPVPSKIGGRGKVKQLNRETFSNILESFLSLLDVKLKPDQVSQFIDSRNTLVHQGQFYRQAFEKDEADGRSDPLPSISDEYFFIVTMLDRIFLRLVGYEGEHRDWTTFPDEEFVPVK